VTSTHGDMCCVSGLPRPSMYGLPPTSQLSHPFCSDFPQFTWSVLYLLVFTCVWPLASRVATWVGPTSAKHWV